MSEHLPECAPRISQWGEDCICKYLRACEQRTAEAMRAACIAAVEALPAAIYSYRPDESLRDVGLWKSNLIAALREVQP